MKWVVPFMHANAYRMNKDKVNMLIAFKVFSSFLFYLWKCVSLINFLFWFHLLLLCWWTSQLFCLYTWYLWANDEILYSNAALCASLLMLCYAVQCLIFYYFPVRRFFFSLEMKWKKNEKIVYTTAAADNRQHRTRMVYISFSFFRSLIWYAPRSVFMIWDFVAQSVPKASNWSQKRAFTTVSGPFWKSLCRQIKPKFIENNEEKNSIPRKYERRP